MMRSGLKVKVQDGLRSFVRSVYILDGDHWFKHNGELVKIQPLGNGKYRANWFTSVVFPYKEEA